VVHQLISFYVLSGAPNSILAVAAPLQTTLGRSKAPIERKM